MPALSHSFSNATTHLTPSRQFVSVERTVLLELLNIQCSCKMTKAIPPCNVLVDDDDDDDDDDGEDYIDMDISSSVDNDATSTFLRGAISSPPHAEEFEFRMGFHPPGAEAATCPADELFYQGKLLPLHHVLLGKRPKPSSGVLDEKLAAASSTGASTGTTPLESCSISPASSCFVSSELSAEDYFSQCSSGLKKSWSQKLKSIGQSSMALKLKASRDFLKSLFTKSTGPDVEPVTAKKKADESGDGYMKAVSLNPLSQIQMERYLFDESTSATSSLMKAVEREKTTEEQPVHRKSFSGAINWNLMTKPLSCSSSVSSSSSSTSSSSSASSNGFHKPQLLKRSNSVNSEAECSVQGAIAYCKKSQQLNSGRSDVGFYSSSLQQITPNCMDGLAGFDHIQLINSAPVLTA